MNARTCLAAAWIALISMAPLAGQQPQTPPADAKPEAKKEDDAEQLRQFLDSVTVSATLNPESLKDTPSTVSVPSPFRPEVCCDVDQVCVPPFTPIIILHHS